MSDSKLTNFHKGDRVEYTDQDTGQIITGTVTNLLRGDRITVKKDKGGGIRWGAKHFRPSNTAAPKREHNPFTAGDRVKFTDKKETFYGTVRSVRDERISVDIDGGMMRSRGHFKAYQKA